jgi:hypothetical protein
MRFRATYQRGFIPHSYAAAGADPISWAARPLDGASVPFVRRATPHPVRHFTHKTLLCTASVKTPSVL